MPRARNPMTVWVLEHRVTEGLNIGQFLGSLPIPSWLQAAKRLHLTTPQRFTYWRTKGFLPWAVYLACCDLYGTPKFHEVPQVGRARHPTRLPPFFERYLHALTPPQPARAPCAHTFRPTTLGYSACVSCGERGVAPPVEAAPVTAPAAPPAFAIPITWQGPDTLTVRLEIVTPPAPAGAVPTGFALREKALVEKIQQLEDQLADLRASQQVNAPFSKDARHLIKRVAKQDPSQARALAAIIRR